MLTRGKTRRWTIALVGVIVALSGVALPSVAMAASSTYQGGDGDPSGCASAYTVKSAPIYGQRGITAGKQIGVLELRYSAACRANWSRVTLYQQNFSGSNPILIQQDLNTEGRWTTSSDYDLSVRNGSVTAWGRYIRLNNVNSTACAQTWVSSNFGTLNYHTVGARVCA